MNRRFAIGAVVPRFFALACVMALIAGGTGVADGEDLGPSRQAMQAPGGTFEEQLAATEVHPFPFPITSAETEVEASFSRNGHTMYFTCWGRSGAATLADICVSHLQGNFEDGQWTQPEVLSISSTSRDVEPKISPSGNRLFFQSDRPGGFGGRDIYYTDLVDGEWQPPVHLPAPINTPFEDHCLYFVDPMAMDDFDMDATAYLASTRPGTLGSNDIWVTHRVNGVFSTPVNLGPPVNGKGNDHMAKEGPDGRLWVTSTKPGNLADEDLFVSERQPDGSWGPLIDLGPPFNTPSREICVDFVHEMNTGPLTRSDDGSTHAMGNVIYGVFGSTRTDPGNAKFDLFYFRMDKLLRW